MVLAITKYNSMLLVIWYSHKSVHLEYPELKKRMANVTSFFSFDWISDSTIMTQLCDKHFVKHVIVLENEKPKTILKF